MLATPTAEAGRASDGAVALYVLLAFTLTWGGILALVGRDGFPATDPATKAALFPAIFGAMALGPLVSAIAITAMFEGRAGIVDLLTRLRRLPVDPIRLGAAVVLTPALGLAILSVLSAFDPAFRPAIFSSSDPVALLLLGLGGGLMAGFFEEVGWTGFALHKLLERHGAVLSALIVGVAHGVWHIPAGYWGDGALYGADFVPYYLAFWIGGLIALRLLIVWLYRPSQSVPLAQLAHASFTGGMLIVWPTAAPAQTVAWTAIFSVLLALAAALLLTRLGGGAAQPVRAGH